MSATNDPVSTSLPWLTMWFRPRRAIDRVIAENRHFVVLALAAAAMSSEAIAQLILASPIIGLHDWRIVLGVAVLGAVVGLLGLYLGALVLGWIARLFRGSAPRSSVRAALAWGGGPIAIGLPISLVVIGLLWSTGTVGESVLMDVLVALTAILGLWALVVTIAMFARIEGF